MKKSQKRLHRVNQPLIRAAISQNNLPGRADGPGWWRHNSRSPSLAGVAPILHQILQQTVAQERPRLFQSRGYSSAADQGQPLFSIGTLCLYCNCIVTRGGVYDEISPEPEGNPEGGARGISRGLRRYFIVYPDSSHNTVILNHLYQPIFSRIEAS